MRSPGLPEAIALSLIATLTLSARADESASAMSPGGKFGSTVAGAGDVNGDTFDDVLVGAPDWGGEGRAFLFYGSLQGVQMPAGWTGEIGEAQARFGDAVAGAGDVDGDGFSDLIVGAARAAGGGYRRGKAVVYHGSASGPSVLPDWSVDGTQDEGCFGCTVASAGDVNNDGFGDVIVGEYLHDDGAVTNVGRAHVYLGSAEGLSSTATWTVAGEMADRFFGRSVSGAGDVNGDGYDDVIVGAIGSQTVPARINIYPGSSSGLSTTALWSTTLPQGYGWTVAGAGDVNEDGYDDVIVGSYQQRVEVFGYHGPSMNLAWAVEPGEFSGLSIAAAGDVNNDGYDDVVLGDRYVGWGTAFVYHGSNAGLGTAPSASIAETEPFLQFAYVVAGAGDVNNDGYDDVMAGNCPACEDGRYVIKERVRIFHGASAGVDATIQADLNGDTPGDAGVVGATLEVRPFGSATVIVSWTPPPCHTGFLDYAVYEGTLGQFDTHAPAVDTLVTCTTGGATITLIDTFPGDRYFLVVPRNTAVEGSLGTDSAGTPRPQSTTAACLPRAVIACP